MQESFLSFPQVTKSLQAGRVVTIYVSKYRYVLAMVLQVATKLQIAAKLTVLLLCGAEDVEETVAQSLVDATEAEMLKVHIFDCFKELYLPDPPLKHVVVDISSVLFVNITDHVIKVDPLKVINDYKKRQIPRFR